MRTTLRFFGTVRDSAYGTLQAIYAMPILYLGLARQLRAVGSLDLFTAFVLVASMIGMSYPVDGLSAAGYGAVLGFVWSGALVLLGSAPRSLWITGTIATAVANLFSYEAARWLNPLLLDNVRFPVRANFALHIVAVLYFTAFIYVYSRLGG